MYFVQHGLLVEDRSDLLIVSWARESLSQGMIGALRLDLPITDLDSLPNSAPALHLNIYKLALYY